MFAGMNAIMPLENDIHHADLARTEPLHLGVEHRLNELAGRNANSGFLDDLRRLTEGGEGVVVERDGDIG